MIAAHFLGKCCSSLLGCKH